MHGRSSLLSIVVISSALSLLSPTIALSPSSASPSTTSSPSTPSTTAVTTFAIASPGQQRQSFDLPLATPLPIYNQEESQLYPAGRPDQQEDIDTADLHRRWDNLCDGCAPSTGVTSFHGATKSYTVDCNKYPKARRTVVTTKTKKVFTSDDCKTTTLKKVKETVFVLWVRQASFADNSPATRIVPSLVILCTAVLCGGSWLLLFR